MNQSSIIAAGLVIGFIVFITVRGELPGYIAVFDGTATPSPTTVGASTPSTSYPTGLPSIYGTTPDPGNAPIGTKLPGGGVVAPDAPVGTITKPARFFSDPNFGGGEGPGNPRDPLYPL